MPGPTRQTAESQARAKPSWQPRSMSRESRESLTAKEARERTRIAGFMHWLTDVPVGVVCGCLCGASLPLLLWRACDGESAAVETNVTETMLGEREAQSKTASQTVPEMNVHAQHSLNHLFHCLARTVLPQVAEARAQVTIAPYFVSKDYKLPVNTALCNANCPECSAVRRSTLPPASKSSSLAQSGAAGL